MSTTPEIPQSNRTASRILLLQGPVGPFFRNLQHTLVALGFTVKRVLFNAGDKLFAYDKDCVNFTGHLDTWEKWLRAELGQNQVDFVVFFGCMRPAHQIARKLAKEFGLEAISLEEGYLRTGYITCEANGNNQHSQLCNWQPSDQATESLPDPLGLPSSFVRMCLWGATYYLWRDFFTPKEGRHLYHRKTSGLFREMVAWVKHYAQGLLARFTEASFIRHLCADTPAPYILVPLQMPADSQMETAARGWTNETLVKNVLFALKSSPIQQTVVFKVHPLDVDSSGTASLISRLAHENGIANLVATLRSGSVSNLTKHASGMIVINSTSAFSALHHNVPLLVMGDAIYRHSSIVTVGKDSASIEKFFKLRTSKDRNKVLAFVEAVRANALLPGDFYHPKGRQTAARAVAAKINLLRQPRLLTREATE